MSEEQAITEALELARLDESDRSTVAYYLREPDGGWRDCCGSNCIPCMQQVAQAVDCARGLLGLGADGKPS